MYSKMLKIVFNFVQATRKHQNICFSNDPVMNLWMLCDFLTLRNKHMCKLRKIVLINKFCCQ